MSSQMRPIMRDDLSSIIQAANVIRHSYAEEAVSLGLTHQNCPTHPAFTEIRQLHRMLKSAMLHAHCLGGEDGLIGFLLLRELPEETMEVVRLCVEPSRRNQGHGTALQRYAERLSLQTGRKLMTASIAADYAPTRNWFLRQGYLQKGTLRFPNLPYRIGFIEKRLGEE